MSDWDEFKVESVALDIAGLTKFRQSDEVANLVRSEAEKMAGGGEVKSFIGFDRAVSIVYQTGAESE